MSNFMERSSLHKMLWTDMNTLGRCDNFHGVSTKLKIRNKRRACSIIYTGWFIETPHRRAQNLSYSFSCLPYGAIASHLLYSLKSGLFVIRDDFDGSWECMCVCVFFSFVFDTAICIRRKRDMISFLFITHFNIYIKTSSSYLDEAMTMWLLNQRLKAH